MMQKYKEHTTGGVDGRKQSAGPIDITELANIEFEHNGQKVKIGDAFKDDEGFSMELLAAIAAVNNHMNTKAVSGLNYLKPDALGQQNKLIDSLKQEVAKVRFYKELARKHSDAEVIEDSEEYKQFLTESSAGIKRLAASWDPEEVSLVIDAFKEKTARAGNTQSAATATKNKQKKDAVHSEAVRPGDSPAADNKTPAGEFDEAFNDESAD